MQHLIRRIALSEALYKPRPARPCLIVHRYQGETVEDALEAEGHDRAAPGRTVIAFRRPYQRDAAQGGRR